MTLPDSYTYTHIDFNMKRPMLRDRNVRLALAYATDRHEIIDNVEHGAAVAAETDQSPQLSWAYSNRIEHHPFDPSKAEQILDADGWKRGPDGVRVKNGQRLSLDLTAVAESSYGRQIETVLQRQWNEIGAEVTIKNVPSNLMFENGSTGTLQGGHYDVALFSWVLPADPGHDPFYSGDDLAPHGSNSLFWNNRAATDAMRDALRTLDRARRKRDYEIVQQQMAKDVPTIVLFFWKVPFLYSSDIKGLVP